MPIDSVANFLAILSTLLAIAFLIRTILAGDLRTRLRQGILFLCCTVAAALIYFSGSSPIPLTPEEHQNFRTSVLSMVGAFRIDPLGKPISSKAALEELKTRVEENPRYEEKMPQETALFYRLYSGSMLAEAMSKDPRGDFLPYLRRAAEFIEKSYELDPSIWEQPVEESAYELFIALAQGNKQPPADEFIRSLYSLNMVMADEREVHAKAQQTIDALMRLAGEPKANLDYFRQFSGSSSGLNYESLLASLEIMIEGQGGRFDGPFLLPADSGRTLVKYTASPRGKPRVSLEWQVDRKAGVIEATTPLAQALHDALVQGKGDPSAP